MSKFLIILGLIIFSINVYATDPPTTATGIVNAGKCITWSFKSKDIVWKNGWDRMNFNQMSIDMGLINDDLNDLKTSYNCVHKTSQTGLPKIEEQGAYDKYKALISDATEANKYASAFKANIVKLRDDIKNALNNPQGKALSGNRSPHGLATNSVGNTNNGLAKYVQDLEAIISATDNIITNSSILASGNFKKYDAVKPNEMCVDNITNPIIDKIKDDKSLQEDESIVSKITKLSEDKTISADPIKLEQEATKVFIGTGDQTDPTQFSTNLQNNKYALAVVNPSNKTLANDNTNVANNANAANKANTANNANSTPLTAEQQKLKDDEAQRQKDFTALQEQVKLMQLKDDIPPASTTTGTTPGGGGASGSINTQAPQPLDLERDAERKKWLERAKKMDEDSMRRAMTQAMKSGKGTGKLAFSRGQGSAFSLRDLFSKPSDDIMENKTTSKEKDMGILEKGFGGTTQQTDKYKKYYKMGEEPEESSSRDLSRSNFDSMYEQARIKALTEGATQELAGRYVNIFLLMHSILYGKYIEGSLVDTSEIVKSMDLKM
ncbi:MAG: hypothetical protein NTY22_02145 [Proteobacteria bacterium]|nr:hypothetical protein [Pseudomonadota bacterium]